MKELFERLEDYNVFIFDFDGTLINSEPYHRKAYNKLLTRLLGREINLSKEVFDIFVGQKDSKDYEMLIEMFPEICISCQEMIERKKDIVLEMLRDDSVKIFDYFNKITELKQDKKIYIVSNQYEKVLDELLTLKGIRQYFDEIFCLAKMRVEKSVLYHELNNYIDVKDKKVVVFEDSNTVLGYAKNEGFLTVGIESEVNRGRFTNADYIIIVE